MRTGIKREIAFRVWAGRSCAKVADAAFRVLERTGRAVNNAKARRLLEGVGCLVEGDLVRIPYGLAKWAVARAPRSVTPHDRQGASPWSCPRTWSTPGAFVKDIVWSREKMCCLIRRGAG
jgi:hypothetical protein